MAIWYGFPIFDQWDETIGITMIRDAEIFRANTNAQ